MEKEKTSKKALKGIINDSMQEAISKLDLPKPGKKARKLLSKSSKRLAIVFAEMIKRETKKRQKVDKSLTYVEDVLTGKKKEKKGDKKKHEKHADAEN